MKMRVYELAENLKIPAKELILFLKKEGIKVKNHMSALDKDTIELIEEVVASDRKKKQGKNGKAIKVIQINKMLSLKELSLQIKVPLLEMMQKIIKYGKITSVDKEIPMHILETLVGEYDYTVEYNEKLKERKSHLEKQKRVNLVTKSPVVTIIGHVDLSLIHI